MRVLEGNDVKIGAIINDDGKAAQEYLELIKLRFEQVGFSNPTVWVGKLPELHAMRFHIIIVLTRCR